jgi:L-fuconolactonase
MDIVDAQVHANVLGTEATLAVMDALGIQGLLFDGRHPPLTLRTYNHQ